jgi:hypothetical protein
LQGHSKEHSREASGADRDQKTLLPSEIHTICLNLRAIIGEFHSNLYFQQCQP